MVSDHKGTICLTYTAKPGYEFPAPLVLQCQVSVAVMFKLVPKKDVSSKEKKQKVRKRNIPKPKRRQKHLLGGDMVLKVFFRVQSIDHDKFVCINSIEYILLLR